MKLEYNHAALNTPDVQLDVAASIYKEALQHVTYKDWEFAVIVLDGYGNAHLQGRFRADGNTWSTSKWILSPHMTKSEIVQTALKCVLTAEEHEAREHFLYKGQTVFGPHFDVEGLCSLCQLPEALDAR